MPWCQTGNGICLKFKKITYTVAENLLHFLQVASWISRPLFFDRRFRDAYPTSYRPNAAKRCRTTDFRQMQAPWFWTWNCVLYRQGQLPRRARLCSTGRAAHLWNGPHEWLEWYSCWLYPYLTFKNSNWDCNNLTKFAARDIQKWEYVPLGPFLAKNFGTRVIRT